MEHDYCHYRTWGHDVVIDAVDDQGGAVIIGWGYNVNVGDFLILPNGSGSTRYQVMNLLYKSNPVDMWRGQCQFALRETLNTERQRMIL